MGEWEKMRGERRVEGKKGEGERRVERSKKGRYEMRRSGRK